MITDRPFVTMQKIIRFLFKVLTILVVDLVVATINAKVILLDRFLSKEGVVLAGMAVVLLLFYSLLSYIEKATNAILKLTVSVGKVVPWKSAAMFIIILFLYFVVFLTYYYMWFNRLPFGLPQL